MIELTVQYFGVLKAAVGEREERFSLADGASAGDVADAVIARHPQLSTAMRGVAIAIDERLVPRQTVVPAGATIALLPPVSGG